MLEPHLLPEFPATLPFFRIAVDDRRRAAGEAFGAVDLATTWFLVTPNSRPIADMDKPASNNRWSLSIAPGASAQPYLIGHVTLMPSLQSLRSPTTAILRPWRTTGTSTASASPRD